MTITRGGWRAAGLTTALIVAAACGTKRINDILADPGRYHNQQVTVAGTVTESVSVLGRGAYRISDGGSSIWVVTTRGAPRKGARVKVTGQVQEGFDLGVFGGLIPESIRSGVVLLESSHKADD